MIERAPHCFKVGGFPVEMRPFTGSEYDAYIRDEFVEFDPSDLDAVNARNDHQLRVMRAQILNIRAMRVSEPHKLPDGVAHADGAIDYPRCTDEGRMWVLRTLGPVWKRKFWTQYHRCVAAEIDEGK